MPNTIPSKYQPLINKLIKKARAEERKRIVKNLFPNKNSEYNCWYKNGEIVCADFSKIGF